LPTEYMYTHYTCIKIRKFVYTVPLFIVHYCKRIAEQGCWVKRASPSQAHCNSQSEICNCFAQRFLPVLLFWLLILLLHTLAHTQTPSENHHQLRPSIEKPESVWVCAIFAPIKARSLGPHTHAGAPAPEHTHTVRP